MRVRFASLVVLVARTVCPATRLSRSLSGDALLLLLLKEGCPGGKAKVRKKAILNEVTYFLSSTHQVTDFLASWLLTHHFLSFLSHTHSLTDSLTLFPPRDSTGEWKCSANGAI